MIDATIESLKTDFDLETETDVSAFLGIHIQCDTTKYIVELTQLHLINNILNAVQMKECHCKATPPTLTLLGSDDCGLPIRIFGITPLLLVCCISCWKYPC